MEENGPEAFSYGQEVAEKEESGAKMKLQVRCQVWSLICVFCIVLFDKTDATQARKENKGVLVSSKDETGQHLVRIGNLGNTQIDGRKGRGGDEEEVDHLDHIDHLDHLDHHDHYSSIEMLLRKGDLEQNKTFVGANNNKDQIKNGIGLNTVVEPDFDSSLGSWLESLLYSDYSDDAAQDILIHKHGDGHSEEMGHNHPSHSEPGKDERHHGDSDNRKIEPISFQATSVSMATWLVSFSSITVISLVRSV